MTFSDFAWRCAHYGVFALSITLLMPDPAAAVCRVVEPIGEDGVAFDPTTTVVVVQAPDQIVDYHCTSEQQLPSPQGFREFDDEEEARKGDEESEDSRPSIDRMLMERPEEMDPSICPDGTPAYPVRDTLTHVVMQPSVFARGGRAGLVMPIHRRSDVHAAPESTIELVAALEETMVHETIEFVEDASLGLQCSDPHYAHAGPMLPSPLALYGCGDGGYYRPGLESGETSVVEYSDGESVQFEAIPVSADYTATVLSATTAEALFMWLDDNGFAHDVVDDAAFRKYVGEDHWFVAIDVHPEDLGGEQRALAPLVVTYRGDQFPITHELTFDPDGGIIETDLFVLAEQRMRIEQGDSIVTYANAFSVPSESEIGGFGLSSGWMTRIHMERNMSDALQLDTRLVAESEELAFEPIVETVERTTRVRIAQACCPGNAIPDSDAPPRTFMEERTYAANERPSDDTLFYSAPAMDSDYCYGGAHYDEPYSGEYACAAAGSAVSWGPIVFMIVLGLRRRRKRQA